MTDAAPPTDAAQPEVTEERVRGLLWSMPNYHYIGDAVLTEQSEWLCEKLRVMLHAHPEETQTERLYNVSKVTCGQPHPKQAGSFKALREKQGIVPHGDGCGKEMALGIAYRCAECGDYFHIGCIKKHLDPEDAPSDECARCGAAACRMAKLRVICEDCLPLAPVKYWKDGAVSPEDAPGGPWWLHTAEGGWTLHCEDELGGFEEGVHLSEDHGFTVEAAEGILNALNRDALNRLKGDEK